jgi:hypothetical protein
MTWLRQAGPTFDASLAMEFLGFEGPEIKEGLASHLEKRPPIFPKQSPFLGANLSIRPTAALERITG